MDNINLIYKILKAIETSMDYDEFDERLISADRSDDFKKVLGYINMAENMQKKGAKGSAK